MDDLPAANQIYLWVQIKKTEAELEMFSDTGCNKCIVTIILERQYQHKHHAFILFRVCDGVTFPPQRTY